MKNEFGNKRWAIQAAILILSLLALKQVDDKWPVWVELIVLVPVTWLAFYIAKYFTRKG